MVKSRKVPVSETINSKERSELVDIIRGIVGEFGIGVGIRGRHIEIEQRPNNMHLYLAPKELWIYDHSHYHTAITIANALGEAGKGNFEVVQNYTLK